MKTWWLLYLLISPWLSPQPPHPAGELYPVAAGSSIKQDTFPIPRTIINFVQKDTNLVEIEVPPITGDNADALQNAINYQLKTPGTELLLTVGDYYYSRPLIYAVVADGKFKQCTPRLRGAMNAKNAPSAAVTNLYPTFTDAPGISLQLAKGGYVKNLALHGKFSFPNSLSVLQIDTLGFDEWTDGKCRQNTTSPYAGIAVDPFSDPKIFPKNGMYPGLSAYYLPGMNREGSTAVNFDGLSISQFVVGFIISPSNQQNGEIIHLNRTSIKSCKVAYAMCQAQSKQCIVYDFECWGQCHTVFDNGRYGIRHGDGGGIPDIDGANIAGINHQLFSMNCQSFHGSFKNIYSEGTFKMGYVGGTAGATLIGCTFDFQNSEDGLPSPDCYMQLWNTVNIGFTYRIYGGQRHNKRITLEGGNNTFIGGNFNVPPVCKGVQDRSGKPTFINVAHTSPNTILNRNDYDTTLWYTRDLVTMHVNPKDFSGWFVCPGAGKMIRAEHTLVTWKKMEGQPNYSFVYPLGFVSRVNQDTVFLVNVGLGIKTGDVMWAVDVNYKKGVIY